MPTTSTIAKPASALGALLREWRAARGKSQIDLSLDIGVSQRHLSFLESGRSSPSRATLLAIADGLDVPLRERNALLLAAGFAPLYPEAPWDAAAMQGVKQAIERMLRQHDPYPAVVMDRYWNVVQTNASAPRFFGAFIDIAARPSPRNLLHLLFDPNGMRPFIEDWERLAASLIQRVYREAVGRVLDAETRALLAALSDYPAVPATAPLAPASDLSPVISYRFLWQRSTLNYFSMVTTIGSPNMVAAQELRVECLFPTDAATEALHETVMRASRAP